MVSYNTLEHIHLRLNEIKGYYLNSDVFYGNINIIVFGDLYQLQPVFGRPVFTDMTKDGPIHLWKDFFKMYELNENKRQSGDLIYAQLLNRIRTGEHTENDFELRYSNQD
jgi:hypothetical protein